MAETYTREWKFRAWNPEAHKMLSPEDLEEPDTAEDAPKTIFGKLVDGVLRVEDYKTQPPVQYLVQQCTNWYDKEQNEIYEGDIVEVDGKIYQVIWDDITSGYLFLGDDMETTPGGAYLGDFIKIEGNIFENGDADPEDRRRVLKFRAWDPTTKTMYLPEDIKDPETDMTMSIYAYLSFGALYIYDLRTDPPVELIPMQSTGWKDMNGVEVFEGDIIAVGEEEVIAEVSWSDEVGQFILVAQDGSIYPGSDSLVEQTKLVGTIYQNPELVPKSL
ncbi:MAG: YopX family protein [Anaerovoracaceae bacterium]